MIAQIRAESQFSHRFRANHAPRTNVQATGNSILDVTYDKPTGWSTTNMEYADFVYTFTATDTSTTLTFFSLETRSPAQGPVLDNVMLTAVPLPPHILPGGAPVQGAPD